jgi:tetratricopeptide (TPR) repeat protein/peroxiredoxin
MGLAYVAFRAAPLLGSELGVARKPAASAQNEGVFPFSDVRLKPHYPSKSPLSDVLRLVTPGSDEYVTERYAIEISALLAKLGSKMKASVRNLAEDSTWVDSDIEATSLHSVNETSLRSAYGINVVRRHFTGPLVRGRQRFFDELQGWLQRVSRVETTEFEIYGISEISSEPLAVNLEIRYDIVASRPEDEREERVGSWRTEWRHDGQDGWKVRKWEFGDENLAVAKGPVFIDVTSHALGGTESYIKQMLRGADYWRTVLDGAIGADVYSNNGVAAGDFDNDGFDDFYVCQPAGLPNRLYRNLGDGTFEDVTEKAGVAVLDNTACALFADFNNSGRQDLLVVCGTGPLLFLNQGNGTFVLKRDAFKFAAPPEGTFTHAAVADYDRDGRLDIYFCTYMYYLGLDQYHYPIPYYDARNGPPNCLFHNEGDGNFVERTEASGLNVDNDRYSFACAWGDSNSNGLPDLFVVNDFGSSQLYRNNGNGTFTVVSKQAHVEDVGAGMSCCWCDFDNDGRQDVYVPSMWEAAGQRVSSQSQFHEKAPQSIRTLYQRHAKGNALYRNQGDGTFKNIGEQANVEMGRWSWSSDFWDFDHDGYSDLYVANGYISAPDRDDMASFFWRQVVAKSSEGSTPSMAYEHGWSAINELIRSDSTWHGYARNVMFANNRDGTFSEISAPSGLDFLEDSRAFALADIDHDGRLEVILRNRNEPQLRILHNVMKEIGRSIVFRLRGHTSNRDAIGSAVTVEAGSLRQTKYLQAGSGFLSQHSKELSFGLGDTEGFVRATVHWPNGLVQEFDRLPVQHRIEIEEGETRFIAKAFASVPSAYEKAGPELKTEPLPPQVETWLISPIKAPEFALPDQAGNLKELKTMRGNFVLLHFWAANATICRDQLETLQRHRSQLSANHVEILSVNLDEPDNSAVAHSLAARGGISFPILSATEEVAGIYNIIYRYMYDRRRDLPIPISFLLDREGMIVKVYQGMTDPEHVLSDVRSMPATTAERMNKAIPFRGELHQGAFQRNEFTYGVALFQHGYLDQAEASFQQVIVAKPDDAEGYYNLGTLSLRRNKFAEARNYLEQTLKLRPNYPEAWNNLGMMAAQEGHPEEAIRAFDQSLQLRPNYAIAHLNLGNVYRRQGDFAKAGDHLHQAVDILPDDAEINYSLGMFYAQQNDLERASAYLHNALALRPDYPEALNNLGVLLVRQQDYTQAEEQFKLCIRLVPKFDQSYMNLARLYAMRSDRQKAVDILQALLRLEPDNQAAKQALGLLQ